MSVTRLTASASGLGAESRTLRVGVVGAGFVGRGHAEAARRAGATVVAATASRPERATAAAESLAAGTHVVCEKPLATGVAEAGELAGAVEDRVATVPFVYRFHPMVREVRARVAAEEAGVVTSVTGGYLQDWLSRPTDDDWRIDSGQGGASRAFGDIGSHWSDLFEFVTGDRIARLSARTAVVHGRAGQRVPPTEDLAAVLFTTTGGVVGTLIVSQVAAGRKNRPHLELSGTDTSFVFDQEDPERLLVGRREGGQVLLRG